MPERYKGIYKGLDKQFWDGFNSTKKKKVNCFIEAAINVRKKNGGSMYKPAFAHQFQAEQYYSDPYVRSCPVHPDNIKVFALSLRGKDPELKQAAYRNYQSFMKQQTKRERFDDY